MDKVMSRFRIGTKIYTGFGVVIALLIGLSVMAYMSLYSAEKTFGEYRGLARDTNLVGRLQANVLMTRLGVKDFIIRSDQSAIELVQERLAKAKTFQAESVKEIQAPTRAAGIRTIGTALDGYETGFDDVIALQAKRNESVEILNANGPDIRKKITSVAQSAFRDGDPTATYWAGRVQEDFMLARLYAQKFLIVNDQESADRTLVEIDESLGSMETLLGELQNPQRLRSARAAKEQIGSYRAAFEDVVRHITNRNEIIHGTLDVLGPQIAKTVEEVKLSVKGEQDTLGPQAVARLQQAELTQSILAVIAAVMAIAAALVIARSITIPVRSMTGAMQKLADGQLETKVPATDYKDEVGDMAKTVQVFKDNALERERLEAKAAEDNAATAERQKTVDDLITSFRTEVEELLASVTANMEQMQGTTHNLSAIAERTSERATSAASSSEEASSNVQTVASASEQLGASIQEIAGQVNRAMEIVGKATGAAQATNDQVASLAEAARKIGDVVNLISDIAEQTNLLALNATIEAARAGEAGRGFAVVASEVKQLAEQTAKATDEIGSQISGIQSSTGEAATAIEGIAATMEEVNTYTANIASAVEEQDAATKEISRNAQQAAEGTTDVSSNVADVSSAVVETRQSAEEMQNASATASEKSAALKQAVDQFLSRVAAA